MTTREKIEEEIRKYRKNNRISKIIGFVGMSILFAMMILFWQALSYDSIDSRAEGVEYVNNGRNQVQIITGDISESVSQWVYLKYTYLESVNETLTVVVLFGSSTLVSSILVFLIMVPMFGSFDMIYYDEFNLNFFVNGKKTTVGGEDSVTILKGIPIYDLKDLGDTYKFKANTYHLIGVIGTEEFEVEKWKVTPRTKKWIWF